MEDKYFDIINMPHHVSKNRLPMREEDRAAQFAPFAALTGYDGAICDAGRKTVEKAELSEESIAIINRRLNIVSQFIYEMPSVTLTFFENDNLKSGGNYVKLKGNIIRIDEVQKKIFLSNGISVCIEDIYNIEGEFFENLEEKN